MAYKNNYDEFKKLIEQHHITTLYHFTDRENLESIIKNGGLYSWADCEQKGISISKPGGSLDSRNLDKRDNLQNFVRVSFVREHPMMYVAMNDGRISNPVVLEIDPEVIYWQDSLYADRNASKSYSFSIHQEYRYLRLYHSFPIRTDADKDRIYRADYKKYADSLYLLDRPIRINAEVHDSLWRGDADGGSRSSHRQPSVERTGFALYKRF